MFRKTDKIKHRNPKFEVKMRGGVVPVKKNIRHKKLIDYQVKGTEPMQFCRHIKLTEYLKRQFGKSLNCILPPEARKQGVVPWLSVFRHTKGGFLVIRCTLIERQENLKYDENGKPYLEPRTDFKM